MKREIDGQLYYIPILTDICGCCKREFKVEQPFPHFCEICKIPMTIEKERKIREAMKKRGTTRGRYQKLSTLGNINK